MYQIPEDVIADWQEITDLVADYCDVPACLVMRGNPDTMEVMVRANRLDDPYSAGETAPRNNKLYCETVIKNQRPLEVVEANIDPEWRGNPDTELGLVSYYGVPVNWPTGENFGTFCILDKSPKHPTSLERRFIDRFSRVLEGQLRLIELSERYEYDASHDSLTGILNRRLFFEIAQRQISSALRVDSPMALIEFDIDYFKSVNDEFGHAVGDKVLQAVTQAVSLSLREADLFARTGGEEFCVLGNITDAGDPLVMAERVRAAVEQSAEVTAIVGKKITVSCGVSKLSGKDDPSALLQRADEALYEAKSAGRNCCRKR